MRKLSSAISNSLAFNPVDTASTYAITVTLDGNVYTFDPDFIHLVRYALSTFCIDEMTAPQKELFQLYIQASTAWSSQEDWTVHTEATAALDMVLYDIAMCTPDDGSVTCGYAASHTYTACPTPIDL